MSRNFISNAATAILVICALSVTGLVVRRELFSAPRSALLRIDQVSGWRDYAASGHAMGPANAPDTVIEFADFECPACRLLNRDLDSLSKLGSNEFRLIYRHFPLRIHRFALPAVRVSECAGREGRFTEMHDALFQFSDSLGLASWGWFANRAGIADSARFLECVRSTDSIPQLASDTLAGNRLGVIGTPTVIVNGLRFSGAPPLDTLQAILRRAHLKSSSK
jgi:protein-disulfide isomerase